jgi:protein-S-isoprenylcysteine O-methyltransferase Ste14
MNDPEPFHLMLAAGLLTVFPVAIYHRLKAHATGESLDRTQEGWFILLTLRPIGLFGIGALFVYLLSPRTLAWGDVSLPDWLRWSGIAAFGAGAVLLAWTLRTLGPNLTDTVVTRANHALVTSGPYRWVRHPFYGAIALLMIGAGVAAANAVVLVPFTLVYTLLVIRTNAEEARLIARFGDDYRHYMRRTGRFLPGIGAALSKG